MPSENSNLDGTIELELSEFDPNNGIFPFYFLC